MSPKKKSEIESRSQGNAAGRSRRRQVQSRAQESIAQTAALWSDSEPVREPVERPRELAREPEDALDESKADGGAHEAQEIPTSAQLRVRWERERFEGLRRTPGAMAFYEEALARSAHQGALEVIAKANGLSEDDVRQVWERFLENHRERVVQLASGRDIKELRREVVGEEDAMRTQEPQARSRQNETKTDAEPERMPEAASEDKQTDLREENDEKDDDVKDADKEKLNQGLDKQSRAHLQRVINEEIGREEYERCLQTRRRLAQDASGKGRFRWAALVKALLPIIGAAVAATCAWFVFQVPILNGFVEGFGRLFSTQTIAVVDRTAARSVIADLARTESLSTVMAANEVFEELFAAAAANVAARLNATVLDAKAVIATANAGSVDATEAVKDEIGRLVRTSRLPQKTLDSIDMNTSMKAAPGSVRGEAP